MNEPRDTLVGDALRRFDVPDHAPDFWDRLDTELADRRLSAGEPADAPEGDDDHEDAEVIELGTAREARRSHASRSRRVPAVAAAAAAAVALALGLGLPAVQQAADGDAQVDMADQDPAPAPDAMQPAPETSESADTTTTTPGTAVTPLAAEELAGEWLTLLRAGDVEGAYARLDDTSQAQLDLDGFREVSTGLAEGAAAFAGDGVTSDVASVGAAAGELHVVTFSGDVEREGMIETAGYPVVVTDTGVHFSLDGPQLELDPDYAQASGTTLASPLEVLVSDTADTWLWIDDGDPERFLSPGGLTLDVEGVAGAGTHIVSLVAIEGGRITARAYTVMVP